MRRYARIENDKVFEVISLEDHFDIKECFHPSLIWVECPENVTQGYAYNGVSFTAPNVEQ